MTTFYKNYVALCAQKKKSASAVATEIGLSRTSPNGWKNGKNPSDINLEKIADYFGVSVDYLTADNSAEKENNPAPGGAGLSLDNIKKMLNDMSTADLSSLIADAAAEIAKRGAGK